MFTLRILLINTFVGKSRRGRLVNWVEKAGLKKIKKILEISEWERHQEILLTAKSLHELSRNPSSCILPVIPRPLPVEVVEGEHYVVVDLLTLVPGSLSPAQTSETEVVGQELAINFLSEQLSLAKEDPGVAPLASKEVDRGSRPKRFPFTKKGYRPASQASKKGRRVLGQRRTPGTGVEDFVLWVASISSLPPASEEEEREEEMDDLIHNFGERKRKRGASFE